jgi:hypothetical protein
MGYGKELWGHRLLKAIIFLLIAPVLLSASCTVVSDRALADLERQAIADSVRASLNDYQGVLNSHDAFLTEYYYKNNPLFDCIELDDPWCCKATFSRDGGAQLIRILPYDRPEHYSGTIDWTSFAKLSYLLDRLRFFQMARKPAMRALLDADYVVLRAWPVGESKPIEVEYRSAEGPIEFWALRRIIKGEVHTISWKPVK